MKTRSNMPLFVVECTDITKLTDDQINMLHCGDYLVKKTGKQRHAYKVTYKEDGQGICLTYHDASTVETVAYDFTDGHWVYNSTDKSNLPIGGVIADDLVLEGDLTLEGEVNYQQCPEGTITDALGLDSSGKVVKGAVGGGTKLYKHVLSDGTNTPLVIIDNISTAHVISYVDYNWKIDGQSFADFLPKVVVCRIENYDGSNQLTNVYAVTGGGGAPLSAKYFYPSAQSVSGGSKTICDGTTYQSVTDTITEL